MSVMAALISEIKPSVTATTTTSASLNAPAASVRVVLQEHPNALAQRLGRLGGPAHHVQDVVAGALPCRRQFT